MSIIAEEMLLVRAVKEDFTEYRGILELSIVAGTAYGTK